jgi:hypothetical protein
LQSEAAMTATGLTQPQLDTLSNTYVVRDIILSTAPPPDTGGAAAGIGTALGHGRATTTLGTRSPGVARGRGSAVATARLMVYLEIGGDIIIPFNAAAICQTANVTVSLLPS